MSSGVRKASVPTTLGEVEDYEFVVDTEETAHSTPKSGWSRGTASGAVQTGLIKDADDPELLIHHAKSVALAQQVDEIRAQRRKTEKQSCEDKGSPEKGEKTSREAFIQLLTAETWNRLSSKGRQYLQFHFRKEEYARGETSPPGKGRPLVAPAHSADTTARRVFSQACALWKKTKSEDYDVIRISPTTEAAAQIIKDINQ